MLGVVGGGWGQARLTGKIRSGEMKGRQEKGEISLSDVVFVILGYGGQSDNKADYYKYNIFNIYVSYNNVI